eukprot:TRINITY_DN27270_c0_g1_i1.p2 TRINITY_DN27270_c0_g1~~TRINITY_DN27270_c0_g1_i1.p2  ORF type:complete len:151 (+),score=54.14 TRINITY_DN27270_c0_g1_i1:79-531(+)
MLRSLVGSEMCIRDSSPTAQPTFDPTLLAFRIFATLTFKDLAPTELRQPVFIQSLLMAVRLSANLTANEVDLKGSVRRSGSLTLVIRKETQEHLDQAVSALRGATLSGALAKTVTGLLKPTEYGGASPSGRVEIVMETQAQGVGLSLIHI